MWWHLINVYNVIKNKSAVNRRTFLFKMNIRQITIPTIGQRVKILDTSSVKPIIIGKVGTICKINTFSIGIHFDKFIHGHNCEKTCPMGHGWFVPKSDFETGMVVWE